MTCTLLQVNSLSVLTLLQCPLEEQPGLGTARPRASVPAPSSIYCANLSKSLGSFEPGFPLSPTGIMIPALPTLGDCFKTQQEGIRAGGGGAQNQLREGNLFR